MRRTVVLVLLTALLFVTGCTETPATAPTPTTTVTVTAPAEEVEKTPQACLDALDYADEGFGLAFKVIGYFEPAMNAVLDMDVSKMRQVTGKIRKASKKMGKLGPDTTPPKTNAETPPELDPQQLAREPRTRSPGL